jgi:phage shock protein C
MEKKLFRNEYNKAVAGVASGLADYMQVDVTIIRLLFILSTIFFAGAGALAYIILWIVVPVKNDINARFNHFNQYFQQNNDESQMYNSPNAFSNEANSGERTKWNTPNFDGSFNPVQDPPQFSKGNDTGRTIGGLVLLILGVYFLMRYTLGIMPEWLNIFKIYKLWPIAIVAIGISLIFKKQQKTEWDNFKRSAEENQKDQPESVIITPEPTETQSDETKPEA